MRVLSFRARLLWPTLFLATLVAGMLVFLVHSRTQEELLRSLEHTLWTKWEEVHSVLAFEQPRVELESFLELETSYRSSPFEYFYELVDREHEVLLRSSNLRDAQAGALGTGAAPAAGRLLLPHPRVPGERVLVHSARLPEELALAGRPVSEVRVAVSLRPYEEAVRASLLHNLIAAAAALLVLGTTLWVVVGRSLRRVSEITQRASTLTSHNLRERLPRNGSGDELDQLSAVLNEMLTGLERSLLQMENFTSDAAHQMRTPLTRIRGEIDLILGHSRELAPETRERLEETRQELERLGHTCARLLLLARLDRCALERDLLADDIDLLDLARDLVEQVVPLAEEKGVRVSCTSAEVACIRCSRPLLGEALLNLLDNAIRFTPPGGRIEVAVRRSGGQALVSISDTGPGIPEAERELVFRRFFRGPGAGDTGTGLGLAIVRGIARAHGGDVTLQSSSSGACFEVSLPVDPPARRAA